MSTPDPASQGSSVSWKGYVALVFALVFFSGILKSASGEWAWLRMFDFTVLLGGFGEIVAGDDVHYVFRGLGGNGARDGFLFALELMPAVIFALASIAVIEAFGALDAARQLLTPLLKPLIGVPGGATLALISSLQSTDAGAAMTRELIERGQITDRQRTVFTMWQLSAGATITNFFSSGAALFQYLTLPIIVLLAVMFIFKFVGANLLRIYLAWYERRHPQEEAA